MIKLTFITGGELVVFKIDRKRIFFSGKPTNYSFLEWNVIMPAENLSRLRAKRGEKWYKEFLEAENKFEKMESDDEIAEDLITDMEYKGLKLIKKEIVNF